MPPVGVPAPIYPWARAPCDECPLARDCRARRMACDAFALYLEGGAEKRWRGVARIPSAELYVRVLESPDRPRRLSQLAHAAA